MIATIREILEGIAILLAMIAVIAIPHPAEKLEAPGFHSPSLLRMSVMCPSSQK